MENKKMSIKEITFGVVFIALFMLAGLLWINVGEAKEEYKPLTPQAQTVYDSALRTLCEAEKNLANAKIMDVANGVDMDVDLNALNTKRDKSCDFQ